MVALGSAGILDDRSYLEREHLLPDDIRTSVGAFRFHWLARIKNIESPQAMVSIAPPWLLERTIDTIDMRVRPRNVLIRLKVSRVSDLKRFPDHKLQAMQHMGVKSMSDLAAALRMAVGPIPQHLGSKHGADVRPLEIAVAPGSPASHEPIVADEPATFHEALEDMFARCNDRDALIMRGRMGFLTDVKTLQDLGRELGVTRERIRQAEKRFVESERRQWVWRRKFDPLLKEALAGRTDPLPLLGLQIVNPWFGGVADLRSAFEYALEQFSDAQLSLLDINGATLLSRLKPDEWMSVVGKARNLLAGAVPLRWTEAEARLNVAALLSPRDRNFGTDLFMAAAQNAVFSDDPADPVLIGFGRGAEVAVKSLLSQSDRPLHFREIAERLNATGRETEVSRAHAAAAMVGLLFARGTYGLKVHFPLSEDETSELVAEVEGIITTGPAQRQWHCREICEILGSRGLDFGGRLTQYILNIALSESALLKYLGRLIWAAQSDGVATAAERIDVSRAAEALLRSAGGPMRAKEIMANLTKARGLGATVQIHEEGSLVRMAPGLWGLSDRDVPLTASEQSAVLDTLEQRLVRSQKGLHISELVELLQASPRIAGCDPILIASLAQRSGRMRLVTGGFLCLRHWEDARRMQPADAVRESLQQAGPGGMTASDLHRSVEALLGRPMPPANLYGPLAVVGARFDDQKNRWCLADGDLASEAG